MSQVNSCHIPPFTCRFVWSSARLHPRVSPPSHTLPRRPHPFGPPHVLSSGSLRSPGTEPTREKRRGTRPFAGDSRRNRAKEVTAFHSFPPSLRSGVSLPFPLRPYATPFVHFGHSVSSLVMLSPPFGHGAGTGTEPLVLSLHLPRYLVRFRSFLTVPPGGMDIEE